MLSALRESWTKLVRHRIFPPLCARPDCRSTPLARIWQRRPPIRMHNTWFCSPRCLELQLLAIFDRIALATPPSVRSRHRVPLGLLMLAHGYLNEIQLQSALAAQHQAGRGKIGEWLQSLGFATERQVVAALGMQWACPPLRLREFPDRQCTFLLPHPLQRALRLMPVRWLRATRTLYVALSEKVDYAVLSAIEQVLDCRTVPCLVSDRLMDRLLEQTSTASRHVRLFDRISGSAEMSRIAVSYVGRTGATEVRVAGCGPYLWVRLQDPATDLLFTAPGSIEKDPRLISSMLTSLQQPVSRVFAEHAVLSLPTTQASLHTG
jgi:hypothetical protein